MLRTGPKLTCEAVCKETAADVSGVGSRCCAGAVHRRSRSGRRGLSRCAAVALELHAAPARLSQRLPWCRSMWCSAGQAIHQGVATGTGGPVHHCLLFSAYLWTPSAPARVCSGRATSALPAGDACLVQRCLYGGALTRGAPSSCCASSCKQTCLPCSLAAEPSCPAALTSCSLGGRRFRSSWTGWLTP